MSLCASAVRTRSRPLARRRAHCGMPHVPTAQRRLGPCRGYAPAGIPSLSRPSVFKFIMINLKPRTPPVPAVLKPHAAGNRLHCEPPLSLAVVANCELLQHLFLGAKGVVVLAKVFTTLRDEGLTTARIADELAIPEVELHNMVFGFAFVSLPGGGRPESLKPAQGSEYVRVWCRFRDAIRRRGRRPGVRRVPLRWLRREGSRCEANARAAEGDPT